MRIDALSTVLLLLPFTSVAYPMQAETKRSSEPGVTLIIRPQGEQHSFQIGELIRLDLTFTSTVAGVYKVDTSSYTLERMSSTSLETFTVEPAVGWDDPLAFYFQACEVFFEGGFSSQIPISMEPVVIHLGLNQWVRFRKPGQYHVRVRSNRVFDPSSSRNVTVWSNELILNIIPPSKQWQQEMLQQAIMALDMPDSTPGSQRQITRLNAAKILTYLGTPSALHEIALRMTDAALESQFSLGLIGSPDQHAALEEMERLLADPQFPVTNQYVRTLSVLALSEDRSGPLRIRREKVEERIRERLKSILPTKQGLAQQVSSETLLRR